MLSELSLDDFELGIEDIVKLVTAAAAEFYSSGPLKAPENLHRFRRQVTMTLCSLGMALCSLGCRAGSQARRLEHVNQGLLVPCWPSPFLLPKPSKLWGNAKIT